MTEIIVNVEVGRWGKAGRYFEQIGESIEKMHTHDNKAQLDTIDEEKMRSLNDGIEKKHKHDNKAQLDTIDAEKMANINDGIEKKHSHDNRAVLDKLDEETLKKVLTAAANIDNHENRELLDLFDVDENGKLTYNGEALSTKKLEIKTVELSTIADENGFRECEIFLGFSNSGNIDFGYAPQMLPDNVIVVGVDFCYDAEWYSAADLGYSQAIGFDSAVLIHNYPKVIYEDEKGYKCFATITDPSMSSLIFQTEAQSFNGVRINYMEV